MEDREKERKRRFAHALLNLIAMEGMEDFKRAEAYYEKAAELLEEALGPDHPEVVMALAGLFYLYRTHRKYPQAEAVSERIEIILEKAEATLSAEELIEEMIAFYTETGKETKAQELARRFHIQT